MSISEQKRDPSRPIGVTNEQSEQSFPLLDGMKEAHREALLLVVKALTVLAPAGSGAAVSLAVLMTATKLPVGRVRRH